MENLEFINKISIWMFFGVTVLILVLVGVFFYSLGRKSKNDLKATPSESISNNILGLLALILGFSFSMAIERYESRRILTLEEANAIGVAYLRSELIHFQRPKHNKELFKKLIVLRIKAYDDPHPKKIMVEILQVQTEIWNNFKLVTFKDRGELESAYLQSLNELFITANTRTFALMKMLPASFYLLILILAAAAVGLMNFDRGHTDDTNHWRSILFIVLFAILFSFIFDMDHFRTGFVQIKQDALLRVRNLMEVSL